MPSNANLPSNEQLRELFLETVVRTIGDPSAPDQLTDTQSWTIDRLGIVSDDSSCADLAYLRMTRWLNLDPDISHTLRRPVDASVLAVFGGAHFQLQREIRYSCVFNGRLRDITTLALTESLEKVGVPHTVLRKVSLSRQALGTLIGDIAYDPSLPNFSVFDGLEPQKVGAVVEETNAQLQRLNEAYDPEIVRELNLSRVVEGAMEDLLRLPETVEHHQAVSDGPHGWWSFVN